METIEDDELFDKLSKEINELPSDHSPSESKIRELHTKILTTANNGKQEQLLSKLKENSFKGLSDELMEIVKDAGLIMESLPLVLNYLTKKDELAEYLFKTSAVVILDNGLDPVKRRLGPKLEVLGGLLSVGINVKQTWVQELLKNVPSRKYLSRMSVADLENICHGASKREMLDVSQIVKLAESQSTRKPTDDQYPVKYEYKAINKEKLDKAKSLMNDAKKSDEETSETAKKAEDKISEICQLLELPSYFYKLKIGKTPEKLIEELEGLINLFDAVEPNAPYNSDYEVVQKASGGRALCGVYFSKYRAPSTAERPLIIMPSKVMLSSADNAHEIRYLKFSKIGAAENYVQKVKSSSTNVGFSVGGFHGCFVSEVQGSYASSRDETCIKSTKKKIRHASVVQYIWTATKTFQFDQEQLNLSTSAKKHAKMLADAIKERKSKYEDGEGSEEKDRSEEKEPREKKERNKELNLAKSFLERYGSHWPAGHHSLGGILFNTVEAQAETEIDAYLLTNKAAKQLESKLSVGFPSGASGIGGNVSAGHSSSDSTKTAEIKKNEEISYSFSSQALGPASIDPETFSKLLDNNSTWALIDRGSRKAYIPVWEMISDHEFEGAADVLEQVWTKSENKWKKEMQEETQLEKKLTEIVEEDVFKTKNFLEKVSIF